MAQISDDLVLLCSSCQQPIPEGSTAVAQLLIEVTAVVQHPDGDRYVEWDCPNAEENEQIYHSACAPS